MTEQSDLAGRLVETAAQTMWSAPLAELHAADQQIARDASRDVLAAVLPLLADEIEGRSVRENGERFKAGVGFGMRDAAALLRGLAAEVAR